MKPEELLELDPIPHKTRRVFHGKPLLVWDGRIKIKNITGWVDNPRIQLASKSFKSQIGDRELTQDEVFDIMKNDEDVKLAILRDDILQNGLREPIILSPKGRLLDGNRRFFAIKFALEGMSKADIRRSELEKVEARVLDDSCTEEDEQLVLVQENFHASLKIEWPDYVKAMRIRMDREDQLSEEDIAEKYSWPKRKVVEALKILELIDSFITFATDKPDPEEEYGGGLGKSENDAIAIAAKNYQFFNEAQKSFYNQLRSDLDFQSNFFRWIAEEKFKSFPEVRIAYEAWKDAEARSVLIQKAPSAAKEAKAIIDFKKRILKGNDEAKVRIEEFIRFLAALTAAEMDSLTDETLDLLKHAMQRVHDMTDARRKAKNAKVAKETKAKTAKK